MTEAMSRREIEDILSSIRKLVSHDPSSRPAVASVAQPDNQSAPPLGKLVLTSALRVPSAGDTGPDMAGAPEPAAPTEPAASLLSRITRSVAPPDMPMTEAPPAQDKIAQDDAAPIMARDAGNIDDAPQQVDLQDWLDDADIPVPASDDREPPGLAQTDTDATDDGLEQTLARLEAMLAGADPDDAPPAPAATTAPESDGQVRAESAAAAQGRDAGSPPPLRDDTPVIDEAMLYQLVADIVRQELQGELGEKITRAIRKLVRAEVARELQLRNH